MAHALTGLRLLAVVPAAWAFSRPDHVSVWLLVALMTLAIVTDYYDGVVARTSGTASPGGMLFDHTTDFLFVTSGLAGAALAGLVPTILPLLQAGDFCADDLPTVERDAIGRADSGDVRA